MSVQALMTHAKTSRLKSGYCELDFYCVYNIYILDILDIDIIYD